jgi:hypothetical protein
MVVKLKPRRGRITLSQEEEKRPVRIIADAAIAIGRVGDGRLIPLVILDTTERSDLEEFIRVHQFLPPGDVICQWGQLERSNEHVALIISFKMPADLVVIIEFDIIEQGCLVEQILIAKGLYLQAGRDGDRLLANFYAPKVLVEIPDTGYRRYWDHTFHRQIMRHLRKRGLSRREAKQAASQAIRMWQEFGQFRLPHTRHAKEPPPSSR